MTEAAADLTETEVNDEQVEKFFNGEESGLPEAESQPETEKAAAEPETAPEQEKHEKYVPHGALHEERMRRKELQEQLEQNQTKVQRMEETFQKLQERLQQEQGPRFEENPAEYLKSENDQLRQRLEQYDARFNQQDEQAKAFQQHQEFVSRYQQAADEYAKATPDFREAYQHLIASRQQELAAAGFQPQQIAQMVAQEEAMIVDKAFHDGVNPAERVYSLAKARGYSAKPAEKSSEQVKMETQARGLEAAKSLSGGQSAKGELTLETLAELEGEELDAAWEKMFPSGM